ncbi:hypothetical protein SAMN05428642_103448 [Flaviramulus basaltis]|uniref:Uncharacterized protein n=1 Tax=Flaviramulus basaltis TaxID=369401 RepID=A0A1K2INC9_9FLAO|nr:DUF6090 family protein [Flaviramulus basaltis]SFZ93948.1 hypothetical protein SAMN05428642_103448 [Flaviramulus basaltis]
MIKIFRNIRKNLINEGKTSKYFKYAIGEIILVVIGILIALQINTWKNEKEESLLEIKIIKELKSNLKLDLVEIQEDIGIMEDINVASAYIKNYLQTHELPSDSLNEKSILLRVTPHFDPNKSGYGLLVSKGIGIISNDSLRNDISLLYERLYSYYKRYEEERLRFHAMHSEPKLLEYFVMKFNSNVTKYYGNFEISKEDYNKLKKDENFFKLMSAITYENSGVLNRAQRVESKIISLISALDEELSIKEK